MSFEWDAAKSASNAARHGIDFPTAEALWADPLLLVAPARTVDEARWLAVGRIEGRHWSAVFTVRGDRVRLISVRRARKEEGPMKARDFDAAFDEGRDVSAAVDWSGSRRPNLAARRVNVDFPAWMVEGLDARAAHLGITRQALIKMWIAERLE